MRRRRYDDDIQRLMADLSAAGLSAGEIASRLGLTKDAAASAMTRYGLYAAPRPPRRSFRPSPRPLFPCRNRATP